MMKSKRELIENLTMNRILIVGAGIGGCAAAVKFAQMGYQVSVIEKSNTIFTEGAGICLYSNALKSLDELCILEEVLANGAAMQGSTEFLDHQSTLLGTVKYKTIDDRYPAYVGINRQKFLEILYRRANDLGTRFYFDQELTEITQTENTVSATCKNGLEFLDYDLLIAADGTNSKIRKQFWKDSESTYSGFGLWHSMHPLHANVKEKIVVIMKDRRFGIIPISKDQMYVWASIAEPNKIHIDQELQPQVMYSQFSELSGYLKDVVDQLGPDTYVHYTAVEEVVLDSDWHCGRIVLLGDSAHASLPFMAQGGAMALQDAIVLAKVVNSTSDLNQALLEYKFLRKPVVDTIQQMCKNIGKTYTQSTVDLNKVEHSLNNFYGNQEFFK
jgi:2-polyprenyl-6-methoxyphenol hydroxylase-like FAD-dependent oxidoreductase